jgi:NOL1/NOP2/sun family putative RNA methylase
MKPAFLERMRQLLGSEFPAFEAAMHDARINSVRVNTSKFEVSELEAFVGQSLERVPWCDSGRYVSHEWRLGSSWLHAAGALYVQEASAMAVALALDPQAGERVLDLCAAPGGKSTHIAQLMHRKTYSDSNAAGLLVCNEIVNARARILAENLERLGLPGVVMNEDPARLAAAWPGFFDRVLVDAPCGGEGMFRKDPDAAREWNETTPATCAKRQTEIMNSAAELLKPGGTMVYSTCTFAPEENEMVIESFLESHPGFELLELTGFEREGFNAGRPEWANGNPILSRTVRLWPHKVRGEGHFMAKLRKTDGDEPEVALEEDRPEVGREPFGRKHALAKAWLEFSRNLGTPDNLNHMVFRDEVQLLGFETPALDGLKVIRAGLPVAQLHKDRLEPAHALSHWFARGWAGVPALDLESNDPRVAAFLHGELLELESETVSEFSGAQAAQGGASGWLLVRSDGLGLGWGKRVGTRIKNHYPKHLRST